MIKWNKKYSYLVIPPLFVAGMFSFSTPIIDAIENYRESVKKEIILQKEEESIDFLFLGDLMLDRYVREIVKKKGIEHLFEKLANQNSNFFQDYDLISVNLEGAVTNNGEHYLPEYANDFAFEPKAVEVLKKYNFNFFNLANNHFSDQSDRGVTETQENLDKLGFDYSGCVDKKIDECSAKIINVADKKVGMVGASMVYGTFDLGALKSQISELKTKTDLIVLNIHWGVEYEHQFNKTQQNIAHELIDAGVDVVIGHHPHVVQGMEMYNNRPIFYSLGNFIFDQYFSADTQEGLILGMNYSEEKIEINLFPIKSKLSQVELMNETEKVKFLDRFVNYSASSELSDMIRGGKIDISIKK